eukprot:TRINITY_DN56712_c0_g1_i1.p2 TRINITY_DN56712_c0_g1~~TRINITY_DN56712_c0_g1_i1.p2  ORF type:complete len:100 (-),score=17.61 TRINITY_DN56712_c0_g1_i1:106-405(-)
MGVWGPAGLEAWKRDLANAQQDEGLSIGSPLGSVSPACRGEPGATLKHRFLAAWGMCPAEVPPEDLRVVPASADHRCYNLRDYTGGGSGSGRRTGGREE